MGLEISKCYSYSFHSMSAKLYEDIGYRGEYRPLLFLAVAQVLKILWHFETLTRESMEKSEMWTILKTADRRAKRTKIWGSGYYSVDAKGTFDARFLEFGLGSFGALSNFAIFNVFQFHLISSKLYTRHPNHGAIQAITFFTIY